MQVNILLIDMEFSLCFNFYLFSVDLYLQERQQKRAAEAKNTVPAQTAAEATRQMLTKKVLMLE